MTWIFIAYLLALVYFTVGCAKFAHARPLRMAWRWFAMIPVSHFFFALVRIGNIRDPHDLALAEIWSNGIEWLLLGLSILSLSRLVPMNGERKEVPAPPLAR